MIACGQAPGTKGIEDHTWNIITLDGNHYHFDFTWNATGTQFGIPGQVYMFLDDETAHAEHFPEHPYPVCSDSAKTFWAINRGNVRFHSDLSKIKIVPFQNNYLAIAKYVDPINEEELEEFVFDWMRDDMAGYHYGSQLSYSVIYKLNLLVFYFVNQ